MGRQYHTASEEVLGPSNPVALYSNLLPSSSICKFLLRHSIYATWRNSHHLHREAWMESAGWLTAVLVYSDRSHFGLLGECLQPTSV